MPDIGGFYFICRFGTSSATAVATQRSFVGMTGTTGALSNANPSAITTGVLGFGADSADTNWFFLHGPSGSTPTKVQLSAIANTFPPRLQSTTLFEAQIFCAPGGSTISYSLEVIGGAFISGTVNTNLPANTTFLSPQVWTNNGTTSAAVGIDVISLDVETEY